MLELCWKLQQPDQEKRKVEELNASDWILKLQGSGPIEIEW
jgi:hypothetical protein